MVFPIVNVKALVDAIAAAGTVQTTMCGYCGNENINTGDTWICSHCENPNYTSLLIISLNDPILMGSISAANAHIVAGDFDAAILEYGKITTKYADPGFIYNLGLLHIQASNHEISSIRYDRRGFMEENALHREKGSALASKAKRIFYKALLSCERARKEDPKNPLTSFVMFMSYIKLGNMKGARNAMKTLEEQGNVLLSKYSEMVFNAEIGKYDISAKTALELTKKTALSMNAFYYIAFALFKTGKAAESNRLLSALGKHISSSNISAMMKEIVSIKQF